MKVLFVSSLSSKFNDQNSSYMHRLTVLKNQLEKKGVETDILYLGDLFFNTPAIIQPFNIRKILNEIQSYDFIHMGGVGAAYAVCLLKPFYNKKIKLIYDVHGDEKAESSLSNSNSPSFVKLFSLFQIRFMEFFSDRFSDFYIVASKALKLRLIQKNINPKNIKVIINGVDSHFFCPGIKKVRSNKFVIGYAGRFQKWQGIDLLVESASQLSEEKIVFKIIGFMETDDQIKKEITLKLKNKVILIDNLDRLTLVNEITDCDIMIIPRIKHPALDVAFPTKFGEFISCGIPVITTNVGDIAKMIDEYSCGFVCDPNPWSLISTIKKAATCEKNQLEQMGFNGRNLAISELDIAIVGDRYYSFLNKIKESL